MASVCDDELAVEVVDVAEVEALEPWGRTVEAVAERLPISVEDCIRLASADGLVYDTVRLCTVCAEVCLSTARGCSSDGFRPER